MTDPVRRRLRLAEPGDVDALVTLVRAAYRGEGGRRGWTTEADLVDGGRVTAEELAAAVDDPAGPVLVVEEEGRLVACGRLQRHGQTAGFGLFAVDPDRQGAGVGGWLLEQAERRAATGWGSRAVRIQVLEPRHELLAFYRRRGYRPTGERIAFAHGDERPLVDGLAFVVLEKQLSASPGP